MAEQADKHHFPGLIPHGNSTTRSAYFVTLFTALLALILILMLWIYTPAYVVLMQDPDSNTLAQVSSELQKNNIAYHYDSETGSVMVPERSLYHAKFVLGSRGIEQNVISTTVIDNARPGLESRGSQQTTTKYFALETELAKTISSINDIQWARVHLAIQDNGATAAENKSRASVFVRLQSGRALVESQLTSISHLVAASVPNLSVRNITIIDQAGNLLQATEDSQPSHGASMRYSYTRMLEQSYINKIESVLLPIFGERSVRVRVDADVTFQNVQQNDVQKNSGQPAHTIKKLSATVVVDNKRINNEAGQLVSSPRSKKELDKIESLVKETIGFDQQRGDRVNVFNEAFGRLSGISEQPSGFFTAHDKMYYLKVVLIATLGLIIIYLILKFLIQKIMEMSPINLMPETNKPEPLGAMVGLSDAEAGYKTPAIESDMSDEKSAYEAALLRTCQLINDNPAHVAKILKTWVRDNGR